MLEQNIPRAIGGVVFREDSTLGTQALFTNRMRFPTREPRDVQIGIDTIGWTSAWKGFGWDSKELRTFLTEERIKSDGANAIPLELYVGMLSEEAIRRIISARESRQPLPDPVGLDVQQFFKIRFELALPSATAQNLLLPLTDMCLKY
ncbi:TPA: hypothetical protein HA238_02030 [Candidatus Micrarchaeota archaeon]|nr:hypothetical protein [Candidatus Micrarchaeota archaeon]